MCCAGRTAARDYADENDASEFMAREEMFVLRNPKSQKGGLPARSGGPVLMESNQATFLGDGSCTRRTSSTAGGTRRPQGGGLVQDKPWRPPGVFPAVPPLRVFCVIVPREQRTSRDFQ